MSYIETECVYLFLLDPTGEVHLFPVANELSQADMNIILKTFTHFQFFRDAQLNCADQFSGVLTQQPDSISNFVGINFLIVPGKVKQMQGPGQNCQPLHKPGSLDHVWSL